MVDAGQTETGIAVNAQIRNQKRATVWKSLASAIRNRISKKKLLIAASKLIQGRQRIKWFGLPCGIEPVSSSRADSYETILIYPPQPVSAVVPEPIDKQFKKNYAGQYFPERTYPNCSVISVENGIAHQNGFTMTSKGKLIPEACFEMGQWEERDYSILKKPTFRPRFLPIDESVVALTSPWQSNYFHWLFDILPRIHLVEEAGIEIGKLYVDNAAGFQRETLSLLGYSDDQIINAREVAFVATPKLIVPSLPGVPGIMPEWACAFLRQRLMPSITVDAHPRDVGACARLYISRSDASRRKVANEAQLLALLERYGFTAVTLDGLSFLEQAELFSQAEIVIAAHGAGLANLVFCKKGTKVLEIHSPYWINACYFDLCYQAGLTYDYLIGQDIILEDETTKKVQTSDIRIEQSQLSKKLLALGVGFQPSLQS